MRLLRCSLLYATCPALRVKVFGIFFDLTSLRDKWRMSGLIGRVRRMSEGRERGGRSDLLLMTPPAEPEAIIQIIPSFTAPFLPANPSGDVLHPGQRSSFFLVQRLWRNRRPGSSGAGQRSYQRFVTSQIFLPLMQDPEKVISACALSPTA